MREPLVLLKGLGKEHLEKVPGLSLRALLRHILRGLEAGSADIQPHPGLVQLRPAAVGGATHHEVIEGRHILAQIRPGGVGREERRHDEPANASEKDCGHGQRTGEAHVRSTIKGVVEEEHTSILVMHRPVLQKGVNQSEPCVGVGPPSSSVGGGSCAQSLADSCRFGLVLEGEKYQSHEPVEQTSWENACRGIEAGDDASHALHKTAILEEPLEERWQVHEEAGPDQPLNGHCGAQSAKLMKGHRGQSQQ
mmetsp:Transcript_125852/g.268480  ORF Transcript_125852/g.268480 Transcript_125852/m.268480 type:complete len:251 (-) Transcript_125852:1378-2130(-)